MSETFALPQLTPYFNRQFYQTCFWVFDQVNNSLKASFKKLCNYICLNTLYLNTGDKMDYTRALEYLLPQQM